MREPFVFVNGIDALSVGMAYWSGSSIGHVVERNGMSTSSSPKRASRCGSNMESVRPAELPLSNGEHTDIATVGFDATAGGGTFMSQRSVMAQLALVEVAEYADLYVSTSMTPAITNGNILQT